MANINISEVLGRKENYYTNEGKEDFLRAYEIISEVVNLMFKKDRILLLDLANHNFNELTFIIIDSFKKTYFTEYKSTKIDILETLGRNKGYYTLKAEKEFIKIYKLFRNFINSIIIDDEERKLILDLAENNSRDLILLIIYVLENK
ncbi:MAG: hypothetical protein ACRCUM_02520 [Mycoplasmoidaceae bacterium]